MKRLSNMKAFPSLYKIGRRNRELWFKSFIWFIFSSYNYFRVSSNEIPFWEENCWHLTLLIGIILLWKFIQFLDLIHNKAIIKIKKMLVWIISKNFLIKIILLILVRQKKNSNKVSFPHEIWKCETAFNLCKEFTIKISTDITLILILYDHFLFSKLISLHLGNMTFLFLKNKQVILFLYSIIERNKQTCGKKPLILESEPNWSL